MAKNRRTQKPAPKAVSVATAVDARGQRVVATQTHFSGPLPHPDVFRQYGEIVPNAPERILRVFEDDSKYLWEIKMAALAA